MSFRSTLALAIRLLLLAGFFLVTHHSSLITVHAQSATATLSGTVVDQNGAVVPGVDISVMNPATSLERTARTRDGGNFTVPLLPPGTYTVTARRHGFSPVRVPDVVLNVGDQKSLQIQLKAGDVKAEVQVRSDAPLINESPAVATLIDRQFVENLPLNGRSFQSLIGMTPGVVFTKSTIAEQGQFSVNGQRTNANYFIIDGVSANIGVNPNATAGQATGGTLPGLSASGGTNNLVSIDALEEFKVLSSTFAPEFGRTPGGQVTIVTRGGTNDFHGTLFNYFRNDALDANDWFANMRGLAKPALRQNDFGGVLGGPLFFPRFGEGKGWYDGRNHTFFFFSYEGLRLRLPQTGLTTVPSLNARQIAPVAMQPFLNAFPRPNGRDLANNFSEFNATFSDPSKLNATSGRVDHVVSSSFSLFIRYNHAPSSSLQRGSSGQSLNTVTSNLLETKTLTAGASLAFSPLISNDFRANYSHNRGVIFFTIDSFGGATAPADSLLFPPSASAAESLFDLNLLGTNTRLARGRRELNVQRQINFVNTLSALKGTHQFKFGIDYRKLSPVLTSHTIHNRADLLE